MTLQDVDLGSLPDWLAAVGTVAAAWVAVVLAMREGDRAKRAEAERDGLRRERNREQAGKVVAWMVDAEIPPPGGRGMVFGTRQGYRVIARNVSDEPVFAVKAEIVHGDGFEHTVLEEWDVLPPQGEVAQVITNQINAYNERPYVTLTFTDAAGRRWRRGQAGRLKEA